MENDDNIAAQEKRERQVFLDDEDVLVELLGVAEGDYRCVTVNNSWPEKGLLEGDIVLFDKSENASAGDMVSGDIILIEEEGNVRIGLMSFPGYLETPNGSRPLEAQEQIAGIGLALVRSLRKK